MGSSLDSVLLQKRGVAAFAVLTTPFADQIVRVTAYERPDRPLRAVILDHPMQNLDDTGLDARANALADIAQQILDGTWDE